MKYRQTDVFQRGEAEFGAESHGNIRSAPVRSPSGKKGVQFPMSERTTITNPVLRGFNPDPSICAFGDEYYVATSTFEWFPGVRIYKSRDLKHWKLAARPLDRVSQLDMRGNPDSGGVWAPQLSHSDGKFWLIYSDMKTVSGAFKDGRNYLAVCETIDGKWSDPVSLNSSGFDPSLFHDGDGKKYLVNMFWNPKAEEHSFHGIVMQEYSAELGRLVGEAGIIFKGSEYGVTEAPHLYRVGGYYYLLTAEGGTGYGHMTTVARSKNIGGPYELHPENPLITSRFDPENPLQKAGHASLVHARDDRWYMAYLMGRPIEGDKSYRDKYGQYAKSENLDRGYCPLGRETSLAEIEWRDGWPYVLGGNRPSPTIRCGLAESPWEAPPTGLFDGGRLNPDFQTLRRPLGEDAMSLTARPGNLRLCGADSLASVFDQSHVARRWQCLDFDAATSVAFVPKNIQQMAGMSNYYNTANWTAFYVTHSETKGRVLDLMVADNGVFSNPIRGGEIPVPEGAEYVGLMTKVRGGSYTYHYSFDEASWHEVPEGFPTHKLSDDYVRGSAFTGAFVGMFCTDGSGTKLHADFRGFSYLENPQS